MPKISISAGKEIPAKKTACLCCIEKEPLDMHDLKTTHTELENILKSKEFRNAGKYIEMLTWFPQGSTKMACLFELQFKRTAIRLMPSFCKSLNRGAHAANRRADKTGPQ